MRVHLLIFASIYLVLRFIYRNLQMTHCFLAPFISCVCGWICFFFCIIFDWIFVFRTYRETWIGGEMIKEMIWMFSKICHNVGSSHFLSSFFFYICLKMLLVYVLYDVIYTFEYIDDCCIKSLFTIAGSVLLYSYAYPVVQLFQSIS